MRARTMRDGALKKELERLGVGKEHREEVLGCVIAFVGSGVLVATKDDTGVASSLEGDAAALWTAIFMCIYLQIGRGVRGWMPLWAYVTPVTGVAAFFCILISLALENTQFACTGPDCVWGWFGTPQRFGMTLAMAVIPGILGHTLANLSLTFVHPLTLSAAQLLLVPVGGLYAWAAGVQGIPPWQSFVAGIIVLAGVFAVVTGARTSPYSRKDALLCRCCCAKRVPPRSEGGREEHKPVKVLVVEEEVPPSSDP